MKKMLVSFILGIILSSGIALKVNHDLKAKCEVEKQTQEAVYINQMEADRCTQYLKENKDGVCD